MILAIASVGWGLFGVGALSHLAHFDRFVSLLSVHLRPARLVAGVVVAIESAITLVVGLALLFGVERILQGAATAGALVGAGFAIWIGRLLLTGSQLPCACSFSEAPTSLWSLGRALATIAVGVFAFGVDANASTLVASLVVGAAAGAVLFIMPDAVAWPEASVRLKSTLAAIPDRGSAVSAHVPVAITAGPMLGDESV